MNERHLLRDPQLGFCWLSDRNTVYKSLDIISESEVRSSTRGHLFQNYLQRSNMAKVEFSDFLEIAESDDLDIPKGRAGKGRRSPVHIMCTTERPWDFIGHHWDTDGDLQSSRLGVLVAVSCCRDSIRVVVAYSWKGQAKTDQFWQSNLNASLKTIVCAGY